MSVLDAKARKWDGIREVRDRLRGDSAVAIIVNGTFFSPPRHFLPGFGESTLGVVVDSGTELINISKPVPVDMKPQYKGYFGQRSNGSFVWARNTEVQPSTVRSGVSGLSAFIPKNSQETYTDIINQIDQVHGSQYTSAMAHVGIANQSGEGILFVLFTANPNASDFPSLDRAPFFADLVTSGVSMCYGLDGSGSVGVALEDTDGQLQVVVEGHKHRSLHWKVNNYLVFSVAH